MKLCFRWISHILYFVFLKSVDFNTSVTGEGNGEVRRDPVLSLTFCVVVFASPRQIPVRKGRVFLSTPGRHRGSRGIAPLKLGTR